MPALYPINCTLYPKLKPLNRDSTGWNAVRINARTRRAGSRWGFDFEECAVAAGMSVSGKEQRLKV